MCTGHTGIGCVIGRVPPEAIPRQEFEGKWFIWEVVPGSTAEEWGSSTRNGREGFRCTSGQAHGCCRQLGLSPAGLSIVPSES